VQTTEDDADSNPATQTKGNDADNDNVLPRRQQGDATTSQKRVVVALARARVVAVALATMVAMAAARLVVVAATVMVPVAAARSVAVDLYVSGRMLGLKENLDLMLSSSPFVIIGLILLNDAHRKDRK
jgi:hypothetical protein